MTHQEPDPGESLAANPREERLGELINDFFDRRERGENLSAEQFLSQHPDYADDLRQHLVGLDLIAGLGSSVGRSTLRRDVPLRGAGSSFEEPLGEKAPLPKIPGYEVHKLVGRGGMGMVFKATQISTKRVVALKLLMEGPFATDSARRRFEREIALAAQLRHPNIIPIYDSGNSEGRMYYAMEHVYGMALSDHLRAHKLPVDARLRIFEKICHAVSHAHQRGVVHRDLKPSNILVDGAGEPHILDFGLAKAGSLLDATTSITAQIVGTPAYMSPEQAAGDPTGIDTRTDVYSLGVVLYEMLTDSMPYETNASMGKILHNIAHAEPTSPHKLNHKVDSELSVIVLKALEKNRDARYQSVDSFATDVKRYLAGEPISARSAGGLYLLRKAVRRHRKMLALAALVAIVATGSLIARQQFRTSLAQKEAKFRESQEKHDRELMELREAKKAAQEEAERRIKEAKVAELATDMTLRNTNLPPEAQKLLKDGTSAIAEGLSAGDDLATLSARLYSRLAPNASPPEGGLTKPTNIDPTILFTSPKPRDPNAPSKPATQEEAQKLRDLFAAFLEQNVGGGAAATTQPQATTSQPATTQPSVGGGSFQHDLQKPANALQP